MDNTQVKQFIPGMYALFFNKHLSESEQQDYRQREQKAIDHEDYADGQAVDFIDPYEGDYLYKDAVLVGPISISAAKGYFRLADGSSITHPLFSEASQPDDQDIDILEADNLSGLPDHVVLIFFEETIGLGSFRYRSMEIQYFSSYEDVLKLTGKRHVLRADFKSFKQLALEGCISIVNELAQTWNPDFKVTIIPGYVIEFYLDLELTEPRMNDEITAAVFDQTQKNQTAGRIVYGEGNSDVFRAWWRQVK